MLATQPTALETLADLQRQLGDIPPRRIRINSIPGRATERDLLRLRAKSDRCFELIDGVLVEKDMGADESWLGGEIARLLGNYVTDNGLGLVYPADCAIRFAWKLVRLPDVSFVGNERHPDNELSGEPILSCIPDVCVEVISAGNSSNEMKRKRRDFFAAGVREVWMVDPKTRTVEVFTSPKEARLYSESETLVGGDILPGFRLDLKKLFSRIAKRARRKRN